MYRKKLFDKLSLLMIIVFINLPRWFPKTGSASKVGLQADARFILVYLIRSVPTAQVGEADIQIT